jgi:hypothetical protein
VQLVLSPAEEFVAKKKYGRAILLALESDVSGEVFQVATGRETSIIKLEDGVGARATEGMGMVSANDADDRLENP